MTNIRTLTGIFPRLTLLTALLLISFQVSADPIPTAKLNKCKPLLAALDTGWLSVNPQQYFVPGQKLKHELNGLNYIGVIGWEPKESNDLYRKLVRYHDLNHLAKTPPEYNLNQKLGKFRVKLDELRFSQVDCKNESDGGFTVINNAKLFREGKLKPADLPPLKVWRDSEGRIWSLDHRRLAAMKLSGAIDEVEVEFVAKAEVDADKFKYATETEGKTIFVRVEPKPGQQPMAIVVGKSDFLLTEDIHLLATPMNGSNQDQKLTKIPSLESTYNSKPKLPPHSSQSKLHLATTPQELENWNKVGDTQKSVDLTTRFKRESKFSYFQFKGSPEKLVSADRDIAKIYHITNDLDPMLRNRWFNTRGEAYLLRLNQYALDLEKAYKELAPSALAEFHRALDPFGKVTGRGKSADSILTKLIRKDVAAFEKGTEGITNLKKAMNAIGDGIGGRLTFKTNAQGVVDAKTVDGFVKEVVRNIDEGVGVTEIMNYRARGANGLPYLSDAQVEMIRKASERYRLKMQNLKNAGQDVKVPEPIIIKSGDGATFPDGYTAFHMNIKYPSGITAEVQVRGPMMDQAAEIKHLFYDINAGKPLAKKYVENPQVMASADYFKRMSPADKARMMDYIETQLVHARKVEKGLSTGNCPPLPDGFPRNLSFDYLKPYLIHD